jgi:hypothetical protein
MRRRGERSAGPLTPHGQPHQSRRPSSDAYAASQGSSYTALLHRDCLRHRGAASFYSGDLAPGNSLTQLILIFGPVRGVEASVDGHFSRIAKELCPHANHVMFVHTQEAVRSTLRSKTPRPECSIAKAWQVLTRRAMNAGWQGRYKLCGSATRQGIARWKLILPMSAGAVQPGLLRLTPARADRAIDFPMPKKTSALAHMPQDLSLCLFRVLQEGLHNAVKHSGVTHFEVRVGTKAADELQLTIRDRGAGFSLREATNKTWLGPASMRERVALARGTFSIKSKRNECTEINVRVPLAV